MSSTPPPPGVAPARARSVVVLLIGVAALLASALAPAGAAAQSQEGLFLHYPLDEATGTVVHDVAGGGLDGQVVGDATWLGSEGVDLDGGHVALPDDVLADLDAITVSVEAVVPTDQPEPYWIYGLGNTTDGAGDGYLFTQGHGSYRTSIASGNWSTEQTVRAGTGISRGDWHVLTTTIADGVAVLYLDGAEVARNESVTLTPADIGDGTTTANYLGRSLYDADAPFLGQLRDFRLYDRALTADEVAELGPTAAQRLAADLAAIDLGALDDVTGDLDLPTTGALGSSLSWSSSNPDVVAADGTVTRPGAEVGDAVVDLTVTATLDDETGTRTFVVTVPARLTDAQRATRDADAISIPHADDVRGHVFLPTRGEFGSSIAWSSGDESVVTTSGEVTRPDDGPAQVSLEATVTVGDATEVRSFDLTVREAVELAEFTGYAFSYFTGSSVPGEKIFLAASEGNDALSWQELNGGDPVLESTEGTRGLRDPFLIRSPEGDRFFLIATDLSIGRNGDWGEAQRNGSRYLEIWESTDLVNWSEQRHVQVSPPNAGNTWAPEAYWDQANQTYIVFWASKLYADETRTGETYNRMLYATTRDFVHFSEAQVWQDYGASRIDTTIIQEGDTYHRFTKDEGAGTTGCSDIIQEKSTDLTSPDQADWAFVAGCIGRDAGTGAVEGATGFHANPGDTSPFDTYLFVDEYGGRGYIPLGTDDLDDPDWTIPDDFDLPDSPRHGTVLPVTQAEHDLLLSELGDGGTGDQPDPLATTEDGLVLHYPMDQDSGTVVEDVSGNDHDATVVGGGTWTGDALELDGDDDHVELPDNLMAGMDAITVSMDVWVDDAQPTPYFVYGFGNSTGGAGDGYLFTTGNAYRTSIATGNWTTEQTVTAGTNLPRGEWTTITYTLAADDVATLYRDGVQVGQGTDVTTDPGDIGDGVTDDNWIGRSLYTADANLDGRVRDVMVYDRALGAGEVAGVAGGTIVVDVELDALKVPAIIDPDSSSIVLPVVPGTDVSALDPTFVVADGATVTPTGPYDLTTPVTVTVTGPDGEATRDWEVEAVEMRSPVLPGFNADPNIVRFGDTFYIYATTDGFEGWSGSTFTVWSSTDLVDWTEHDVILDLGPDVDWADSRAWAPTATEQDGTYYFYFSADQNIGVATSDSPLGPFTEPLGEPLVDKADHGGAQQIDPAVFTDVDGTNWLLWGNGTPRMARLADDMTSFVPGTERTISGLDDFREGLFMVERDGTYHLTWSIDDTRSPDYRVGYATSDSPLGPWTNHGVILDKDPSLGILGTGHHSIVQDPDSGQWFIAYHRFAIPGGDGTHRETTIDRLEFGEDGLIEPVVPTLSGIEPLADTVEPGDEPYGYLMVHFLEEPNGFAEKIHLAVSNGDDPTSWTRIDGGDAILANDLGTSGVRDPYLVRNPDTGTYYIIGTDLRVFWDGNDYPPDAPEGYQPWWQYTRHSRNLVVWESDDLVEWGEPHLLEVAPETAGRAWAPEATWIPERGEFAVYFSSSVFAADDPQHTGPERSQTLVGFTSDFTQDDYDTRNPDGPGVMYEAETGGVIDTSIHTYDGVTYRAFRESGGQDRGVVFARTDDPQWWLPDTDWTILSTRIGAEQYGEVEAPLFFADNARDRWFLYVDEYGGAEQGYRPFATDDIFAGQWTSLGQEAMEGLATNTKHGGVMPLTRDEYDRVRGADVVDSVPVEATVEAGAELDLPDTVTVELSDGTTPQRDVTWDDVDLDEVDAPTTIEVTGDIAGGNYSEQLDTVVGGGTLQPPPGGRGLSASDPVRAVATVAVRDTSPASIDDVLDLLDRLVDDGSITMREAGRIRVHLDIAARMLDRGNGRAVQRQVALARERAAAVADVDARSALLDLLDDVAEAAS